MLLLINKTMIKEFQSLNNMQFGTAIRDPYPTDRGINDPVDKCCCFGLHVIIEYIN